MMISSEQDLLLYLQESTIRQIFCLKLAFLIGVTPFSFVLPFKKSMNK